MSKILRLWLMPLTLSVTCGACERDGPSCDYLADGYERLEADLDSLPALPLQQVPEAVVGQVQTCWAERPYGGPQHAILLQDVRKASPNGYYLVFRPWGIADVKLVFLVNTQGRVVQGYQSSAL